LTILRTRYGGHCGFVEQLNGPSFADQFVVAQFERFAQDRAASISVDAAGSQSRVSSVSTRI
jgi:hypothetical protein